MTFVTEFLISLRGIPRPSLAAIKASGYPVALEARADERDKRALTYIEQIFSSNSDNNKENPNLDDAIFLRSRVESVLDIALANYA